MLMQYYKNQLHSSAYCARSQDPDDLNTNFIAKLWWSMIDQMDVYTLIICVYTLVESITTLHKSKKLYS